MIHLMNDNPLRRLPSVNQILLLPTAIALEIAYAHDLIVEAIRAELDVIRADLASNGEFTLETIAANIEQRMTHELRPRLRSVINATGIVLHTNLGRARWPRKPPKRRMRRRRVSQPRT